MDFLDGDFAKPGIVGLMLDGHENDEQTLDELLSPKHNHTHVEEYSKEHGHRDELYEGLVFAVDQMSQHNLDCGRDDDGASDENVCNDGCYLMCVMN